MKPLPEEFRSRATAWGDRRPTRPAAEVAARARAARVARDGRLAIVPRAVLAGAALAALLMVALARPRSPSSAPVVAEAQPPARLVVIELRSGSRLYVDLRSATSRSRR
jgi:hypothetical protein